VVIVLPYFFASPAVSACIRPVNPPNGLWLIQFRGLGVAHTTADQAGSRVGRCGAERYQDPSEELHMARKPAQAKAPGYFAPVAEAKYIVLTTFRRDGEAVSTACRLQVWRV
jgi:hypothetical protein